MDDFVHEVYAVCRGFPKDELYITIPQLKRAALSIALNYIEGFARFKRGNQLQFLEISYGSLKETKYLLYFSLNEGFLQEKQYIYLDKLINEIGAMLWTEIKSLSRAIN